MTTLINIFTNIICILTWNMIIFFTCIKIKDSNFSPEKQMFKEKRFEKAGNFYIKKLKIKKWKDYLPQYTAKNGFSKKSFISKEIKYINRFISETCRAEWNHKMCLLAIIPITLINNILMSIVFSLIIIITNVPYIFIQRYNRLRLLQLKKHLDAKKTCIKDAEQLEFIC